MQENQNAHLTSRESEVLLSARPKFLRRLFGRKLVEQDREITNYLYEEGGLSIRDYFAAKAMQSYLPFAEPCGWSDEVLSSYAYHMADAMLAARAGRSKGDAE